MLWNSRYETGVPLIDSQHKAMFARLDILLDREQSSRIAETIDFLADYVVKHFGDEEILMKMSKYPGHEKHSGLHVAFIDKFKELKAEYDEAGESLLMLMKMTNAVDAWLQEHIMGHDKTFADYLHKMGLSDRQAIRKKA